MMSLTTKSNSILSYLFGTAENNTKLNDDGVLTVGDDSSQPQGPVEGLRSSEAGHEAYIGFDGKLRFRPRGQAPQAILGSHAFLGGSGLMPFGNFSEAALPNDPSVTTIDNGDDGQAKAAREASDAQAQATLQEIVASAKAPEVAQRMVGWSGPGAPEAGLQDGQGSPQRAVGQPGGVRGLKGPGGRQWQPRTVRGGR